MGPNAQFDLALSTIDIPCTTAFNTHILLMRCGFAAAAFPVWQIRRQTPRGLVRISIRLHRAPARGGRSDPRVAWDHREGRSFRRPRNPNWPGPLHRVRHRCRHRLAPRDKPHFERVFGLSLGSACKFRFRRPAYTKWERFTLEARPRSIYVMSGPSRDIWAHSIPPVEAQRYSITFRTMIAKS